LAEREGFEPPIPVKVCPLSRRIVSTAHAPLRAGNTLNSESEVLGFAQDFGSGLERPLNASTFEADPSTSSGLQPLTHLSAPGCFNILAVTPCGGWLSLYFSFVWLRLSFE